ncbi:MAG: MXAN_5187 C-terminal domain-containing protein [Myxococcota bacterium]
MAQFGSDVESDLQLLDIKTKQLRNEYEQYFLGTRPREPHLLRGEVQKMVTYFTNVSISNTAQRFRFNSLQARFFSLRRHWDNTLRKIEDGTYQRQVFKANLRRPSTASDAAAARQPDSDAKSNEPDLFANYLAARQRCGQNVERLDRARVDEMITKQREAIRARTGRTDVRFRVVVEDGRAKLKASLSE